MAPTRAARGRGSNVTNQGNYAHDSTIQPQIRQSQLAEPSETTHNRSRFPSSHNPGLVAQSTSPNPSPSKRWQIQGYVEDSGASEPEPEANLPERQNLFGPLPKGYFDNTPEEYNISNWVTEVPPERPSIPLPRGFFDNLPEHNIANYPGDWGTPKLLKRRSTSAESFRSDATELLSPGYYEKSSQQAKESLWDFHQVGNLPWVDPDSNMEEATQEAAVPRVNPWGSGGQFFYLSDHDRSDILCILSPNSPGAYQAVQLVAENTPQHILQQPLGREHATTPIDGSTHEAPQPDKVPGIDEEMAVDDNASPGANMPSLDIALRLSSKIQNPTQGFAFGRTPARADLLISKTSRAMRISGVHFCIYLNSKGTLMCRDESTNGTFVDGQKLKRDPQPGDFGSQMTIHDNSIIELLYGNDYDLMRFWVRVPDRTGVKDEYARRLNAYIVYLAQLERQQEQEYKCKIEGITMEAPAAPILPFADVLRVQKISNQAKDNLVAGTEPYNHGMQWNGGENYQVTGKVGKGAFANVFKMARRRDGEVFAVKEVERNIYLKHGNTVTKVTQELKIMKRLKHPNIVPYIDHHQTEKFLYIVMEFVPHGDLQTCLSENGPRFGEHQSQAVASQMCHALKYLHDCRITHRDIKPDNILIFQIEPYVFKLSDFGLSKVVNHNETFLQSFCGTLLYCAPEVYPGYGIHEPMTPRKKRRAEDGTVVKEKPTARQPYTSAVDTWGLAAVLYHLLAGQPPYKGTTGGAIFGADMLSVIQNSSVNWDRLVHGGVSEVAVDFLQKMLVVEPSHRLSDDECLAHPWITDGPGIGEHFGSFTQNTQKSSENVNTRDTERADPEQLSAFASQLSLLSRLRKQQPQHDEQSLSEDIEQRHEMVQSKRKREGQHDSEDDLTNPSLVESEDDLIPSILRNPTAPPPAKKMYGEIDPAALRSSGTLGRNAHAALELTSQTHEDLLMSDSHYEGESIISINDYPHHQGRVTSNLNPQSNESGGDAPSLYGAEALVEEMNMHSPMADVTSPEKENHPAAPDVDVSEERTSEAKVGKAGSTTSSQGLYSATPPPSTKFKKPSMSGRAAKGPSVQPEDQDAGFLEQQKNAEKSSRQPTATNPIANPEQDISSASPDPPAHVGATEQGQPSATRPELAHTPSAATIKASKSKTPALTTTPATNLPPPINDFGSLIPTPGSALCPVLKLKSRITSFGRNPIATYQWPDNKDTRVPKLACDIIFWRPGIDHDMKINPNLNWQAYGDITAIITTRTSQFILVNNVQLRRGTDCYLYGKLHTGDIITIFEPLSSAKPLTGKASEYLRFQVEVTIGRSKEARKEGEPFVVIEDKEMFEKKNPTPVGTPNRSREGSVVAAGHHQDHHRAAAKGHSHQKPAASSGQKQPPPPPPPPPPPAAPAT
ncbi:MAG: hypothetical protein LQ352_007410 [Teloschistes flavicans]|nr:MAG: hypothetical protein LQ352_007410 [Teloschistes flavicans]